MAILIGQQETRLRLDPRAAVIEYLTRQDLLGASLLAPRLG
jgi:hypothetical protein